MPKHLLCAILCAGWETRQAWFQPSRGSTLAEIVCQGKRNLRVTEPTHSLTLSLFMGGLKTAEIIYKYLLN